ncbi:flagellar biosynthetic fliU domain protein [Enterobacteriaceae bacterium ATCC 29904]|nr:flagellar biosynthetic fliU domain protein [Enterobacteriaceae bacterium ATCC 29904]
MREIKISEPAFVKDFNCIGGACRDHCCKGWKITLDKHAVKKYVTSKDFQIQTIAEESIQLIKHSPQAWGVIKFSQQTGNCPYLDESRLCMVQKNLGAQALSQTCSVFPRSQRLYKSEEQNSLAISCPEVASLIFKSADAMRLNEQVKLQDRFHNLPALTTQSKLLNLFCLSLIDHIESDVETALYAVVKFLIFIEKYESIDDDNLPAVEGAYALLAEQLHTGQMKAELATLSADNKVKMSLIMLMQDFFRNAQMSRGSEVINHYIECLLRQMVSGEEINVEEKIGRLEGVWRDEVIPNMQGSEFAIKNFILYKFWQNNFPNQPGIPPLRALYIVIAEYYFIKLLMSACTKERGHADIEDLTNIVYSFHSLSQHNKAVTDAFYRHIESVRLGDDISLIHLLA